MDIASNALDDEADRRRTASRNRKRLSEAGNRQHLGELTLRHGEAPSVLSDML